MQIIFLFLALLGAATASLPHDMPNKHHALIKHHINPQSPNLEHAHYAHLHPNHRSRLHAYLTSAHRNHTLEELEVFKQFCDVIHDAYTSLYGVTKEFVNHGMGELVDTTKHNMNLIRQSILSHAIIRDNLQVAVDQLLTYFAMGRVVMCSRTDSFGKLLEFESYSQLIFPRVTTWILYNGDNILTRLGGMVNKHQPTTARLALVLDALACCQESLTFLGTTNKLKVSELGSSSDTPIFELTENANQRCQELLKAASNSFKSLTQPGLNEDVVAFIKKYDNGIQSAQEDLSVPHSQELFGEESGRAPSSHSSNNLDPLTEADIVVEEKAFEEEEEEEESGGSMIWRKLASMVNDRKHKYNVRRETMRAHTLARAALKKGSSLIIKNFLMGHAVKCNRKTKLSNGQVLELNFDAFPQLEFPRPYVWSTLNGDSVLRRVAGMFSPSIVSVGRFLSVLDVLACCKTSLTFFGRTDGLAAYKEGTGEHGRGALIKKVDDNARDFCTGFLAEADAAFAKIMPPTIPAPVVELLKLFESVTGGQGEGWGELREVESELYTKPQMLPPRLEESLEIPDEDPIPAMPS